MGTSTTEKKQRLDPRVERLLRLILEARKVRQQVLANQRLNG